MLNAICLIGIWALPFPGAQAHASLLRSEQRNTGPSQAFIAPIGDEHSMESGSMVTVRARAPPDATLQASSEGEQEDGEIRKTQMARSAALEPFRSSLIEGHAAQVEQSSPTQPQCFFEQDDGWAAGIGKPELLESSEQYIQSEKSQDTAASFLQRSDAGYEADVALLRHIAEQWSVKEMDTLDRMPSQFKQRHMCQEEEPTITAAFKSLDAKSGGPIRFVDLPHFLEQNPGLGMLSVKNNDVTIHGDTGVRSQLYAEQVKALLREVDLPDMNVLISVWDWSPTPKDQVGILRSEGSIGDDLLLIPRSVLSLNMTAAQPRVCEQRHQKAVFRGTATGPMPSINKWTADWDLLGYGYSHMSLPFVAKANMRFVAANLSKHRPDLLDAGFVSLQNGADAVEKKDAVEGFGRFKEISDLMKGRLTSQEEQCYSVVLVIDGNSVPDRLPEQLLWGIPTVFMHRDFPKRDEFWYPELRPGVDFIRAKPENLETVLESLLEDPERYKCIGQNGKQYVQQHLSVDRLKCYMYKLLSDYGSRYSTG